MVARGSPGGRPAVARGYTLSGKVPRAASRAVHLPITGVQHPRTSTIYQASNGSDTPWPKGRRILRVLGGAQSALDPEKKQHLQRVLSGFNLSQFDGLSGSPGKSQKEDQGTLKQLGVARPSSFIPPWSSWPFFWLFPGYKGPGPRHRRQRRRCRGGVGGQSPPTTTLGALGPFNNQARSARHLKPPK